MKTARRRKRRRMVGGAVTLALAATAALVLWQTTKKRDEPPVRHTAQVPTGFGDYRLAGKDDKSLWSATHGGDNLNVNEETAHATYVGSDGVKSYMVTLELDPSVDVSEPGEDDDIVSVLLGTPVDSGQVRSFDPGQIGGTLRCVEYGAAATTSSRCVWGNSAATVTAQPVVTSGPRPTPEQTARDVKLFLHELAIQSSR
ncbi:hypothetical protein [Streptomyces flavofungini]|uniref:hypothetical protein n=1 Tax=Streptomyces flavofungini TaxID=68200 RepID=UPI0034DEF3A0